jgi:uncharacterized protein
MQAIPLRPVSEQNRLLDIDVLRGVALLGILVVNIPAFAMETYFSESWRSDPSNINFWYRAVNYILFEGKMRALFSMIFGAGILLFVANKAPGWSTTRLFYIRMAWLILFGLIDAHLLLWIGDILYFYGVCGLIAYLFRKVKPVYLVLAVPIVSIVGFVDGTMSRQENRDQLLAYREAKEAQDNKHVLSKAQEKAIVDWREIEKNYYPNKEQVAEETAKYKSGYSTVASLLRPISWEVETKYLLDSVWDALALMLLGIALYKWRFLSGEWTKKQYIITAAVGYGLGLPIAIFRFWYALVHFKNVEMSIQHLADHAIYWVSLMYDFQRIFLVMGHVSVIILLLQSGVMKRLMHQLASVGRMALTNYVMQTVICTLLFFGYGFNLYAELEYYQLYFIVLSIWILQLWLSGVWLKNFHFGPLEWVWRSLTYWKTQPMRRQ